MKNTRPRQHVAGQRWGGRVGADLGPGDRRAARRPHRSRRRGGGGGDRPDGIWLASGDGGSLRIWDPFTCGINAFMRVDSPLQDCAWSPSGQSLAAAGGAGLYHFAFTP